MTLEQIEALEAKARNCRDNARAELVVRAAFEDEYNPGVLAPGRTKEMHARSMELYDFVIRGKHRADRFTEDAELFEAAAAMGRAQLALSTPQPGLKETDPRKALADLIASRLLGVPADEQDLVLEDDDWRLIISALCSAPASEAAFQPTHRHVKSGRLERVIGKAEAQVSLNTVTPHRGRNARFLHEGDTLIVYQSANGKLWCRAPSEFNDRRFVEIGTEEKS